MSGHNKWSQIKLKKGKTDAKRSQVFSRYAKLITSEARAAKGNRDAPALRAAIERARKENMPNESIDRAIKKATEAGAKQLEPVLYEVYGPGGVALMIEALTDNKNKTAAEIKHLLSEKGGRLASPGAASWAFFHYPVPHFSEKVWNTPPQAGGEENGMSNWVATTTIPLSDEDIAKLDVLVEALEAHEDVQEVVTNAE
ncbi:MAG: hypothetical protein Greene041679_576 [Parcubacteria group bacterium Greene0416_79]|nr:MAG: hypothetical protein Greene041679_576 [Parcubacteria group bacterium Greene0416_79]